MEIEQYCTNIETANKNLRSEVAGYKMSLTLAEGTIEELQQFLRNIREENTELCRELEQLNEVASTRKDEGVAHSPVLDGDSLTDLTFYKEATEAAIADIQHLNNKLASAQATAARLRGELQEMCDFWGAGATHPVYINAINALALPTSDQALFEFGMTVLQKWDDDALMSQRSFEEIVRSVMEGK